MNFDYVLHKKKNKNIHVLHKKKNKQYNIITIFLQI